MRYRVAAAIVALAAGLAACSISASPESRRCLAVPSSFFATIALRGTIARSGVVRSTAQDQFGRPVSLVRRGR